MVVKDTEQVQICLGVPGISYFDERRFTQNMMNSILGGGLSSRLFQALREERGLAYSVYSSPANYSDTGAYSIYVGTGQQAKQLLKLLLRIDGFYRRVTDEKFIVSAFNKSSIYMGLESVMNRMSRLEHCLCMTGWCSRRVIERVWLSAVSRLTNLQRKSYLGTLFSGSYRY